MHISDYDYNLPPERIAQHPVAVRGKSRLLTLDKQTGTLRHGYYQDVERHLEQGDVVILNDTRVIKARLMGTTGAKHREFLLMERHESKVDSHHWKVLCRGKVRPGEHYDVGDSQIKIQDVIENGIAIVSSESDLLELSQKYGKVPLPPYMHREASTEDTKRYQTEFARESGSVAAPTASLNFTTDLIKKLENKGVKVVYLTLHVGLGTFLPIRTDSVEDHTMHSEYFVIPKVTVEAIRDAKLSGNKILAVGTTVTRTLEYAAQTILEGSPKEISGEADIFIYPGYKFHVADMLLTNFHAPRTTVLMLTAAFAGWDKLSQAYKIAVSEKYDFLSYGDSMLII